MNHRGARAASACRDAPPGLRTRTPYVRVVVRLVVPIFALLLAGPIASASAQRPLVLKVKWRLVVGSDLQDFAYVMGNDRYVTFQRGTSYPGRLTLIDEQTGKRKQLSGPRCPTPVPWTFGGPWLLAICPGTWLVPATYELYDLGKGSWTPFQVSSGARELRAGCGRALLGQDSSRMRGSLPDTPSIDTSSRTSRRVSSSPIRPLPEEPSSMT